MAAGRHHAGATPSSRLRGAGGATGFGSERDGQNRIRENSVRDSVQARDQHLTKNRDRDMDRLIGDGDRRDKDRNGSRTYERYEDAVQRPGISASKPMSPECDVTMAKGGIELNRESGELGSDEGLVVERPKKRKYSPIVWDLDDKKVQSRSSSVQRQVNAVTPPQTIPNRASLSPTPAVLVLSELDSSPPLETRKGPETIIDFFNRGESPICDDAPEPGQLAAESPIREEGDDEEMPAPPTSIAGSRWAEETSPEAEKSPSEKGRSTGTGSADEGPSMEPEGSLHGSGSPEPGEYLTDDWLKRREGANNNVGADQSSGGNSDDRVEARYEEELNKKELMELDEEVDEDHSHDREPEEDSDYEDEPPTPPPQQQRYIDMLKGCRSVDEFERLNKIDEGTYGVVYRARDKKTGEIVALKKVKMDNEREGFPMTSLREINVLLSFHHPAIVDVKEVVVGSSLDSIFMVMEYMEHDLKGLMEAMKQPFSQSEAKCLMLQLFEGVQYLHENWVLHRDLKTSNLLLNNRGDLKICDFGLARQYGSPLKTYTRMVVTLWYRAPELLLGSKKYSTAIDMWSLGCIMAEFLAKEPLFSGKSEIDQLDKIFKTLGTPNEKIWPDFVHLPGVKCNFVRQPYNRLREKFPPIAFGGRPALSERGYDLLNRLLTYDPEKRITAEEALNHEWFREVPLPKMKELMPTFPVRSEQDRRLRRLMKSPDPLEEQRKRDLRQTEFGAGGIFG